MSTINIEMRELIDLLERMQDQTLRNPSEESLISFIEETPHKIAKGLIDRGSGNLYVWDAFREHHRSKAKELGIEYYYAFIVALDGETIDRETFTPGHVISENEVFALQLEDEPRVYNSNRAFQRAIGPVPNEDY